MKRFKDLFESPPGLTEPGEQTFTKSEHGPKKKKVSEQYREEGRHKPIIPRYVKSKGVGPRPTVDSAKVKLKEQLNKATPSVEEIAKKHNVSVDEIQKQLEMGMNIEKEHTTSDSAAKEIALDHLNEKPDYYTKLKKYVEGVEPDAQSYAARTYVEKPQKEPMKKYKTFKEDLRQWFDPKHPKGGWKRINAKGEAIGPCAREPGEAKPKCMSNEKRALLSKKERASAVSAKRRHDPNPERKGKPINVSNFGKGKLSEEMEQLNEKNVPTNPELWSRAKALARSKFDVYPSAYANGWAAKWYKSKGGGWKSVSEEVEQIEEADDKREYDYEGEMVKSDLRSIIANANRLIDMLEDTTNLPEWCQNKVTLAEDYISTVANYMTAEMNEEKENVHDAIKKIRKEDVEQIDELSKSTLASYATKAADQARVKKDAAIGFVRSRKGLVSTGEIQKSAKADKRIEGVKDAIKRLAKEDVEQIDELSNELLTRYKDKAAADASAADKAGDFKRGDKRFSGVVKATNKQFAAMRKKPFGEEVETKKHPFVAVHAKKGTHETHGSTSYEAAQNAAKHWKMKNTAGIDVYRADKKHIPEETKPPFEGGTTKPKDKVIPGKLGKGYSTARHLARQALKKQIEKMKPMKESLQESRKADIVKEIVKKKKNVKSTEGDEKFQKEPVLGSEILKV